MKASLPVDKLERIRKVTQSFTTSRQVTKRQTLSLLGHLNFAMHAIPQGRSFIYRLLHLASSLPNLQDIISLDEGCLSDLKLWSHLLDHLAGCHNVFHDDIVHSSDSLKFFTDAAPSIGFGGYYQGQWFASKWPLTFPKLNSSSALFDMSSIQSQ